MGTRVSPADRRELELYWSGVNYLSDRDPQDPESAETPILAILAHVFDRTCDTVLADVRKHRRLSARLTNPPDPEDSPDDSEDGY